MFSYCNGLRELSEGLLACEGKLSHLGLDKAPARSTLSDATIIVIIGSLRLFITDYSVNITVLSRTAG